MIYEVKLCVFLEHESTQFEGLIDSSDAIYEIYTKLEFLTHMGTIKNHFKLCLKVVKSLRPIVGVICE